VFQFGSHGAGVNEWSLLLPVIAMSIPIIAIIGGIVHGIVKTMGQQRMMELAQRERIAAIERGLDLSKLPPLPVPPGTYEQDSAYLNPQEYARRRAHRLLTGGLITLAAGISIAIFLYLVQPNDKAWAIGLIPCAVAVALLLSAWLTRPHDLDHSTPPGTR
jgi:hypothetical protein